MWAFSGCKDLISITVDPRNTVYSSLDGALFDNSRTTLIRGRGDSYAIPESVTIIEDAAFEGCLSLTNVTIPDSVTSIGGWAFSGCTGLTSIAIPDSVSSIGDKAFRSTGLISMAIPDSVKITGDRVFADCKSLITVTIGTGVTLIGDGDFEGCDILKSVSFKGNCPSVGLAPPGFTTTVTVYYLPGTVGWGPNFAGRPTAPWVLSYPVILTTPPNFGIQTNAFGFRISWATNAPVVVEASITLDSPVWSPVSTNTLTDGWSDFRDPEWANYPGRFYRVRQQ
jgi:hypothetical protein